jgi:hypothetical protein
MPAKAGIQKRTPETAWIQWIPACARMTVAERSRMVGGFGIGFSRIGFI